VNLLTLAPNLLAATSKTKTTGSSSTFLIFIVIVVAALYFLFLRPNQQKAKRARQENASINVGDRVVSIGGIIGEIEEMQSDRVVLLTGNAEVDGDDVQPTRLVLLRSAIARKLDATSMPLPGLQHHDDDEDDRDSDHDAEETGKAEGDTGA